jgi:hypothetical protein
VAHSLYKTPKKVSSFDKVFKLIDQGLEPVIDSQEAVFKSPSLGSSLFHVDHALDDFFDGFIENQCLTFFLENNALWLNPCLKGCSPHKGVAKAVKRHDLEPIGGEQEIPVSVVVFKGIPGVFQ